MNALTAFKTDTRELLLNVAEKLFSDYGFDRTSIRMIANAAKLNIALINYYYGSKKALLTHIFKIRLAHLNAALKHIPGLDVAAPNKLKAFLDGYTAAFSNQSFHRLLQREITLLEVSPVKEYIHHHLDQTLVILKGLVEDGVREGYLKSTDTQLTFLIIFGLLPVMVCGPPLADIIAKNIDPGGQMFSEQNIKTYLFQILEKNQTEYIYRS